MRIVALKTVRFFSQKHADCKLALEAWVAEVKGSNWKSPLDIKKHYPSADILPDNRIVFNIKGNRFRLITKVHYNTEIVFIRFIGTHADYDKIDASQV